MLRWRRVEISGGALLMLAALYYLDGQGVLPLALLAGALHAAGHWLAIRALGGRITALRLTCVGAEMRLSARYPLGYAGQCIAALAGPCANLAAAWAAARPGTEWGYCFAGRHLALGAVHRLPAAQLDGGRVLWCALALLAGRARADRFVPALSAALAAGLVCGALALVWQGRGNLSLLLTALWLLAAPAAGNMRMERLG